MHFSDSEEQLPRQIVLGTLRLFALWKAAAYTLEATMPGLCNLQLVRGSKELSSPKYFSVGK